MVSFPPLRSRKSSWEDQSDKQLSECLKRSFCMVERSKDKAGEEDILFYKNLWDP